jgi:hypothetical protein
MRPRGASCEFLQQIRPFYRKYPVGFYSFLFLLEVEFAEGVIVETAIETVGLILRGLWDRGWAAVAASGYADRLPYEGGVSEELPWPRA